MISRPFQGEKRCVEIHFDKYTIFAYSDTCWRLNVTAKTHESRVQQHLAYLVVIYCIVSIFHPFSLYKRQQNVFRRSTPRNYLLDMPKGLSLMVVGLCTLVLHVAAVSARCFTTRLRPCSSPRPLRRSPAAERREAPSHFH